MAKPKRVSHIVKFCSLHGKFVGFQWGGHRRVCQAKETTATAEKGMKEAANLAREKLHKAVRPVLNLVKLATKPLQKAGISHAETTAKKVISDVKNHLFDLDTEINRLTKECEETQQSYLKKQQLLADARGEKDEIVRGLKQII